MMFQAALLPEEQLIGEVSIKHIEVNNKSKLHKQQVWSLITNFFLAEDHIRPVELNLNWLSLYSCNRGWRGC